MIEKGYLLLAFYWKLRQALLRMKLAGGHLPCLPDHEEGRTQGRKHHRLHVRRYRSQPGESEAWCHHQPSPGWRCLCWGSKGN
jgi:hypothetical protein